jgi:predicted transcriptional regulator
VTQDWTAATALPIFFGGKIYAELNRQDTRDLSGVNHLLDYEEAHPWPSQSTEGLQHQQPVAEPPSWAENGPGTADQYIVDTPRVRIFTVIQETYAGASKVPTSPRKPSVTNCICVNLAGHIDEAAERLSHAKSVGFKQVRPASLEKEDDRTRQTREAMADVDTGRVIDHQAVQTWAESLTTNSPLPAPQS